MKFTIASLVACLMATDASAARLSAMKHKIAEHKELPEEIYYEDMLNDVEQAFKDEYPEEYEQVMSSMNLSMVLSDVPDQRDVAKAGAHHKVDKEIESKNAAAEKDEAVEEDVADEEDVAVEDETVVLAAEVPDKRDVAKAGAKHQVTSEFAVEVPDKKDVAKAGVKHSVTSDDIQDSSVDEDDDSYDVEEFEMSEEDIDDFSDEDLKQVDEVVLV
jgi:hypothetical protein